MPAHRIGADFLAFLKIDSVTPHLTWTSTWSWTTTATHKTPAIRKWLADNPHFYIHFTPSYSSWINQVERWFGIITHQLIRRGTYRSVQALLNRSALHQRLEQKRRNPSSGPRPPNKSSVGRPESATVEHITM